jgi:hypothetical protein
MFIPFPSLVALDGESVRLCCTSSSPEQDQSNRGSKGLVRSPDEFNQAAPGRLWRFQKN